MSARWRLQRIDLLVAGAILLVGVVWTIVAAVPMGIALFTSYAGIGAFLVARVRHNSIGWLLILTGAGLGAGNARITASASQLLSGDVTTAQALAAWANSDGWVFAFCGIYGVAVVFPKGRSNSWLARAGAIYMAVAAALIVFAPTVVPSFSGYQQVEIPNPIGIPAASPIGQVLPSPDLVYPSAFIVVVGAVAGLWWRFRRSTGVERLEYQWLVAAFALLAATTAIWALSTQALQIDDHGVTIGLNFVGYVAVPVAIAVAILRYRLWQIDRLISRTLGWSLATAAVLAVFGLGIVLLQTPLSRWTNGAAVSVAGSTLLAYALFQPIRRRVQAAVDRRFDRARQTTERILSETTDALRDETDMRAIESTVLDAAGSLRPVVASMWIR